MIQEIHDIKNYSFNPVLESNEKLYDTPVTLFGKQWRIMDDFWMKHVHIKITDRCNARCPFCIEKESHLKDNPTKLMANLQRLIAELDSQGHLATVSITGGEPSLSPIAAEAVDFLKGNYNVFLNINTNFSKTIDSQLDPDWVNISRHKVGADDYTGIGALDLDMLDQYRADHPKTKIRLQCVLHPHGLQSIDDIKAYIDHYIGHIDDLSFRRLINVTDNAPTDDLYQQLKHFLYDNSTLVEQVLKDYYVYETWNYKGLNITLSHSNMKLLHDLEGTEDDKILREIVVHPDGLIAGSWYRNKKLIAE